MKESKRQYFPMYFEWSDVFCKLPDEQLAALMRAIMRYSADGVEPELDGALSFMFGMVKPQLDRVSDTYTKIVERNTENGKKSGGRPAKNSHEDESLTDTNVETESPATIDDNSENPTDVNDNVENAENPVGYLGYDENPVGYCENPENPVGTNETKRNQTKRSDTNRSTGDDAAASARPRTVFVKPSADEIAAYCSESGYPVDAECFLAYYDSNGWMVGRNRMKDWRAAIRTWSARDKAMPDKPDANKASSGNPFADMLREMGGASS